MLRTERIVDSEIEVTLAMNLCEIRDYGWFSDHDLERRADFASALAGDPQDIPFRGNRT